MRPRIPGRIRELATRCPSCGGQVLEARHPDGDLRLEGAPVRAYTVRVDYEGRRGDVPVLTATAPFAVYPVHACPGDGPPARPPSHRAKNPQSRPEVTPRRARARS